MHERLETIPRVGFVDLCQTIFIEVDPADAWDVIANPERQAEWFPGMASSAMDGTTRTVVTVGGGRFIEEILLVDHEALCLQYRITGPMELQHHLAQITVVSEVNGCRVVYDAELMPKTLVPVLNGAIGDALVGLRTLLVEGRTSRGWQS